MNHVRRGKDSGIYKGKYMRTPKEGAIYKPRRRRKMQIKSALLTLWSQPPSAPSAVVAA